MAAMRADKEAHDPVSAAGPAEETILVARGQLPQARAEDLAKKEEVGDNKMTSDLGQGSGPGPHQTLAEESTLRPDLMEHLTVSDHQELDPPLDLPHPLDPQDHRTTDHLVMDLPTPDKMELELML